MMTGMLRKLTISLSCLSLLILSGNMACSPNNVSIDKSLGSFFEAAGVEGAYGMFYNGAGTFTLYNVKHYRDAAFSPDKSFEPVLFIAGLETGVIPNERALIIIDTPASIRLSADTALMQSNPLFFSTVARTIGKEKLQSVLDTLQYGSKKITGAVELAADSLTVTPDEQLGLIKKLYFNQLPFQKRSQEIVKKLLLKENNATYQLAYHLSRTTRADGITYSWVLGWVEENKHPYFFVIHTKRTKGVETPETQIDLLKNILRQQGFLAGKK
jgi:beta-lactamase class D